MPTDQADEASDDKNYELFTNTHTQTYVDGACGRPIDRKIFYTPYIAALLDFSLFVGSGSILSSTS